LFYKAEFLRAKDISKNAFLKFNKRSQKNGKIAIMLNLVIVKQKIKNKKTKARTRRSKAKHG